MRKILLVSAIYSLIVNQCCKSSQKSILDLVDNEKRMEVGSLPGKFFSRQELLHARMYTNTEMKKSISLEVNAREFQKLSSLVGAISDP